MGNISLTTQRPWGVDENTWKRIRRRRSRETTSYVIKLNHLCSQFNTAQQEARRGQKSANQEQGASAAPPQQIVLVRNEETTRLNDGLCPEKLSGNATILQFDNWKRDIKSYYFTINAMTKKSRDVQISALYACLDEKVKRFLDVLFASLPNVEIVSDDSHSYLQALTDHFDSMHPIPLRVLNFFNEKQRPNESP